MYAVLLLQYVKGNSSLANSNITDSGVEALTTGAAVGIAVVTTAEAWEQRYSFLSSMLTVVEFSAQG